jgi:hypothetical protein
MPSLSQFSAQSVPSSADALARQNREKREGKELRHDRRDCNPIDNVLGLTLGFAAIAAIIWAVVHLSKRKGNRVIGEEYAEEEEEVTEEMLEEDAMASIAGGLKRRVKRTLKRHEGDLEILDSEEFMRFLRDRLD